VMRGVIVMWLPKPRRWGLWPHSKSYRWILDLGPVRIVRKAKP
jgi:hypothetical protein